MKRGAFLALVSGVVLAGCTTLSETDGVILAQSEQPGSPTQCDASRYTDAIGLRVQDVILRRHSGPTRVVWPWQTVITDLQPDRLNILVDNDGTIANVTCG